MPYLNLTHKTQTKLNDCWYACIQMLKTYQAGQKTKPTGAAVTAHRKAGALNGGFWGHALGANDPQFVGILQQNGLRDVSDDVGTPSVEAVQLYIDRYGPLIVGGDFGQALRIRGTNTWLLKGMGHYIVLVGTDPGVVHVNDPWHTHRTQMPFATFREQVWKATARTIVALDG